MCCFPCCSSPDKKSDADSLPKNSKPVPSPASPPITTQPSQTPQKKAAPPPPKESTGSTSALQNPSTSTPIPSPPSPALPAKPAVPREDKLLKIVESASLESSSLFTDDSLATLNETQLISSLIINPKDEPNVSLQALEKTVKDLQSQKPGPDDPNLQRAQLQLAQGLLDRSGRYKTALDLARSVFESRVQSFGEGHVETLRAKLVYSSALLCSTRHEKALEDFEEMYDILKGKKSDKGSQLLCVEALIGAAGSLKMGNDPQEAMEMLEKGSQILTTIYGDVKNVDKLGVKFWMLKCLKSEGKKEEALTEAKFGYRDLRNLDSPQVDEDDILMIRYEHLLGSLMRDGGDPDIVYSILWEIFRKECRVLGSKHPMTLSTVLNFGIFFERIGRMELAANIYRGVHKRMSAILGVEHPKSVKANKKLNDLLIATGAIYVWRC